MLSSRAKYALRACVYLAEQDHTEQWTLTSDIAAAEDIPHKFLEAILVELRDHNIVQSRRGRYGGHRLARPADEISAGELIRIVDGPLALAPCASKTQFGQCADCLICGPARYAPCCAKPAMPSPECWTVTRLPCSPGSARSGASRLPEWPVRRMHQSPCLYFDGVGARKTRRSDLGPSEGILFAFVLVLPF
jgi:Rrf2 family protein